MAASLLNTYVKHLSSPWSLETALLPPQSPQPDIIVQTLYCEHFVTDHSKLSLQRLHPLKIAIELANPMPVMAPVLARHSRNKRYQSIYTQPSRDCGEPYKHELGRFGAQIQGSCMILREDTDYWIRLCGRGLCDSKSPQPPIQQLFRVYLTHHEEY